MRPFINALTSDLVAGIQAGNTAAAAEAVIRLRKGCKPSNAAKLRLALSAALTVAPAPAPKPAPVRKPAAAKPAKPAKPAARPPLAPMCKGEDGLLRTPQAARKAAWAWRLTAAKPGNALPSYAEACARFGTRPAREERKAAK